MNLQFSIQDICEILGAEIPAQVSATFQIQNIVLDSRSPRLKENSLFFAFKGSKADGHDYLADVANKGGQCAVVEKVNDQIPIHQIQVKNVLTALQLLAQKHRSRFDIPVIGITGSNGKTIVKEWLYHTLKDQFNIVRSPKSYNSQIGVALSVLEMNADHELAIFEAGISAPNEMKHLKAMIQPTLGVFTGMGDAHDANFDSKEQKKAEKFLLFEGVDSLFEASDSYQLQTPIHYTDVASTSNASVVEQVAFHFELAEEEVADKFRTLPTISMRLEQIEGKNNCLLINDAYTSDLAALEIALRHLSEVANEKKKVLILSLTQEQIALTESDALADLIFGTQLNQIIFIGEQNILAQARIAGGYYTNVDAFLQDELEFEDTAILFKGSRNVNLERLVQHYAFKKHVTQLEVNLTAMRHNLNFFRSHITDDVMVLAMVKAQSYGTGLIDTARFLAQEGVNYLGVAYADEGVILRKAGIHLPIIVMNPEESAFEEIIDYDLEPSIYSTAILNSFIHALILKQQNNFPIHIKMDTGMNRLGFEADHLNELISMLNTQPEVYVKSSFSHLASADEADQSTFTFEQMRNFEIMTGKLKDAIGYSFIRHIANSAAIINYHHSHFDMVRVGIGLYGLLKNQPQLENVLSLTSRISQIKSVEPGESVGYGRAFVATESIKIGIIPIGYADGLRRGLSQGKWKMVINGKKAPIIGSVCMDMCMVDLRGIDAQENDLVEVFGQENSIFDMAKELYSIPYEIIAGISSRVHRVYLG